MTTPITETAKRLATPGQEPFAWASWSEFGALPVPNQHVVREWLPAYGLTYLLARRGTGKTTLATDLACHIATDQDWHGIATLKGYKVVYICGEDIEGYRLNLRAYSQEHEISPASERFLVAERSIDFSSIGAVKSALTHVKRWADGWPVVTIMDTWQRCTSGQNKSDQEAMEHAIELSEWWARELDGPMLILAHPPKDGRLTVSGSGVQEDTSTAIWHLKAEHGMVRLSVNRIKGAGKDNWTTFHLREVELEGQDSFGEPLTGLVVEKTSGREHRVEQEARGAEQAAQAAEEAQEVDIKDHLRNALAGELAAVLSDPEPAGGWTVKAAASELVKRLRGQSPELPAGIEPPGPWPTSIDGMRRKLGDFLATGWPIITPAGHVITCQDAGSRGGKLVRILQVE